ncbi:MAG: hypothetical protein AB7S38_01655 [Vulcanimicrobiota bacterium]
MSQDVQSFLAAYQESGPESVGHFTLDPKKAREKMKKFQLTDPHRYVLMLAASAVVGQTEFIRCHNDADDLILEYDGQAPSRSELENLFASLFAGDEESREHLRLRLLAIGLNAALGLSPSTVTVDSWDGQAGHRLALTRTGEGVTRLAQCPWPDRQPMVRIHVRERVSWRTVGKFFSKLMGLPPEGKTMLMGCRFAPVEVTVNGRPANGLPVLPPLLTWRAVNLEEHRRPPGTGQIISDQSLNRALLWLPLEPPEQSRIEFVWNGIRVAEQHLSLPYAQVNAILECDALKLNVSQSDIVDDAAFRELMTWFRAHLKQMVLELAAQVGVAPELEAARRRLLLDAIGRAVRYEPNLDRWREFKSTLIDLPLFKNAQGQQVCLRPALERFRATGTLYTTRRLWDVPPWDPAEVVLQADAQTEPVFTAVFPELTDGHALMMQAVAAYGRQRAFEAQPVQEPVLGAGRWRARHRLEGTIRGELGLVEDNLRTLSFIAFLRGGKRLCDRTIDPGHGLPTGLVAVVDHPDFQVDANWEKVVENEAYVEAMKALRQGVEPLFEQAIEQGNYAAATTYMDYLIEHKIKFAPQALRQFPYFVTLGGERLSMEQLRGRPLGYLAGRPEAVEMEQMTVVVGDVAIERYLSHFVAVPLDARPAYQKALARQRFFAKPEQPVRLGKEIEIRAPLSGLEGEIGLEPGLAQVMRVEIFHHHRRLAARYVSAGLGGLSAVVNDDRLVATDDYGDLVEEERWGEILPRLLADARQLAEPAFLRWREDPEHPLAGPFLRGLFCFEAGLRGQGFREDLDEFRAGLMTWEFFPTNHGYVSLQELFSRGESYYLFNQPPRPVADSYLVLTREQYSQMSRILGDYKLIDGGPRLERELKLAQLEQQPSRQELTLPEGDYVARVELDGETAGQIGLLARLGASRILVYRKHHFLEELVREQTVPIIAIVNDDNLRVHPERFGVAADSHLEELLDRLEAAAGAQVEDLDPKLQGDYLLALLCRLVASRPKAPLTASLICRPLFEGTRGQPLNYRQLHQQRQDENRLCFLPTSSLSPELLAYVEPDRDLVCLDSRQEKALRPLLTPLDNVSRSLQVEARAQANRARSKVDALELEARFPDTQWLARVSRRNRWYRGQLGLAREVREGGIELVIDGHCLATLDVFPGCGFIGCIQGPFKPTETWDGLQPDSLDDVRAKLLAWHQELLTTLIADFPTPADPGFASAQRCVLAWWNLIGNQTGLERQLEQLHVIPITEGRYLRIADLEREFLIRGELRYCRPGHEPTGEEMVLVLEAGSWLEGFMQRLAEEALQPHQPAPTPLRPATPRPDPPRATAPPPPEPTPVLAQKPAPEPPPEPEAPTIERALESEFRLLGTYELHPRLDLFKTIITRSLGRDGPMFELDQAKVTVNGQHRVVENIIRAGLPRERLYFLLSALFSVKNREDQAIEDSHERDFHARILATLLGG